MPQGCTKKTSSNNNQKSSAESHKSLTWAERLKRVFKTDVSGCSRCGGKVKIVACREAPDLINKILDHLDAKPPRPVSHLSTSGRQGLPTTGIPYVLVNGKVAVRDSKVDLNLRAGEPIRQIPE